MKTYSGKVVEQSISYEVTEKYMTECASFHLKYWLKLTYPVVVTAVHAVSVAESEPVIRTSCLKYGADNCTMNFSDVGTAPCSRTVPLR